MNKFMFFLFPKLFHSKTHSISKELEGFDPKMQYPEIPGMKYMKYVDSEDGNVLVAYFI